MLGGRVTKCLERGHHFAAMVVADEMVLDGTEPLTVDRICLEIRKRGWRLDEFVCDPAGRSAEATSGVDQIAVAKSILGVQARFRTDPAGRSVRNGIEHVKALLDPAKDSTPRLYVARDVVARAHTLPAHLKQRSLPFAIRAYSYPEDKAGKPVSSEPVKDGVTDHAMDCVRYASVWYFPMARLMAGAVSTK